MSWLTTPLRTALWRDSRDTVRQRTNPGLPSPTSTTYRPGGHRVAPHQGRGRLAINAPTQDPLVTTCTPCSRPPLLAGTHLGRSAVRRTNPPHPLAASWSDGGHDLPIFKDRYRQAVPRPRPVGAFEILRAPAARGRRTLKAAVPVSRVRCRPGRPEVAADPAAGAPGGNGGPAAGAPGAAGSGAGGLHPVEWRRSRLPA